MEQGRLTTLAAWESFYVIVGSSAAALTGLQFVVIVLGAEMNLIGSAPTVRAFGTPTIVHFCAVLLMAAILTAPWHALSSAAVGIGVCGFVGVSYAIRVTVHARRQKEYVPVAEDWLWHSALPVVAYMTLLVSAIVLHRFPAPSLFLIGGAAVLLLFVGIHNAWDAVMYLAIEHRQNKP